MPGSTPLSSRYVQAYDGGDCFFLNPIDVTERRADIEGFGADVAPFEAFDAAFKRTLGFEANIAVRLLAPAQCPLPAFLRQVDRGDSSLRLSLASVNVRSGQTVSGSVEGFGPGAVDVIVLDHEGRVESVAPSLSRIGSRAEFVLQVADADRQTRRPKVVIAISSPQRLETLALQAPVAGADFFPRLLAEARSRNVPITVAVKYLRIDT